MKTKTRKADDVMVVDISGKIGPDGSGDQFRDRISALLAVGEMFILLNLGNVSYMNSDGVGELVASYQQAKEAGGTIKLLNPSGKVSDQLQLTRLDEIFEIYRDEKAALASFRLLP
jgi:anti-sigma B factor antagonist